MSGSPTKTRTWDTAVNSRLLCQLSYRGLDNATLQATDLPGILGRRTVELDGCWIFTGAAGSRGYGSVAGGRKGLSELAHRVAYRFAYGAIPDGMTIDHLCRVKRCVNPAHLEAVTRSENSRRYHASTGRSHYCNTPGCADCARRTATTTKVRDWRNRQAAS